MLWHSKVRDMLGNPIDITIIAVVVLVVFGPKSRPPWSAKPETYEKNPNSPKDPLPKLNRDDLIIKKTNK